jgi:hypothetical protein
MKKPKRTLEDNLNDSAQEYLKTSQETIINRTKADEFINKCLEKQKNNEQNHVIDLIQLDPKVLIFVLNRLGEESLNLGFFVGLSIESENGLPILYSSLTRDLLEPKIDSLEQAFKEMTFKLNKKDKKFE